MPNHKQFPGRLGLAMATAILVHLAASASLAQDSIENRKNGSADKKELFEKFSKALTGSKFTGSFTVSGRDPGKLTPEEYHIKSVEKMDAPNLWLFTARIKYSDHDVSVPLPLQVLWAGDTPVITVTDFSFLGQGPFSARVVIYDNKYAGTWSHGEVGGLLFGEIQSGAAQDVDVEKTRREHESKSGDPNGRPRLP